MGRTEAQKRPAALAALLVAFLTLHILYNLTVPLGEGPDEPGHLAYVLFLATERRLPVQRPAPYASDVPGEGHQPPLAYLLAVPAVAWLPPEQRQIRLTANPRFLWAGGDEPSAFMRGSWERWPWEGLALAWHLARGISGLWGATTLLCTWLAARRLAPDNPTLAILAAALVAFNPQALFISALVSNDALLMALGAAILCWCLDRPPSAALTGWAVGAGMLFGLALLTKQSALPLGPLLLWGGWRAARGQPARFAAVTFIWSMTAAGIAGWWFGRNAWLYGDPFGLALFRAEFAGQPFTWSDPRAWSSALAHLFTSFWARFGWMSLHPPGWTLGIYGVIVLLALVGWPRIIARAAAVGFASAEGWIGPLIALVMAGVWTLTFALTAGLVAWQGRMLFPALAAIGLLLATGLIGLGEPQTVLDASDGPRSRQTRLAVPAAIMTLGLFLLAGAMPLGVIRPAYSWVALAPHQARMSAGTPVYARFAAPWEQGVVLYGWRLEQPPRLGEPLVITLTWHSLEPIPHDWMVFVHLVDGSETIVAKNDSRPLGGKAPFPLWTPGDWMRDTHVLTLPADLPPGTYRLRVGLFSPDQGGKRQPVWDAAGRAAGDFASLGVVIIETSGQPQSSGVNRE